MGEEAFAEARRRDVPVLVSVGYSTCHWCHVMARETFSDPALASRLNEGFVAIKVDREEHPEVDAALITAAGAFTDQLGWPLNVFTTPEGRTFHAGTYSPPEPRAGHPSFRQVLDAVADAWTTRRDQVEQGTGQLSAAIREASERDPSRRRSPTPPRSTGSPPSSPRSRTRSTAGSDPRPSSPSRPSCCCSTRSRPRGARARARDVDRRAGAPHARRDGRSDLRDPVEGGFFRYSTRRDWSEPHYERMLYDNALLLDAYARAGDEEVAAGIVAFLTGTLRRASEGSRRRRTRRARSAGAASRAGTTRWMRPVARRRNRPRSTARCSPAGTGSRSARSPGRAARSDRENGSRQPAPPPTCCSRSTCGRTDPSCAPRSTAASRPRSRRSRTTGCSPTGSSRWRSRRARSRTRCGRGRSSTR
ncbi:hypothetical protein BC477_03330 [Clavibacter michiganensis subsp. michiganensis]|uniref:Spermatogenesis-associated protein 20-like TRX domain-containing protein n=1 Tax=Clavibacter michiganensis subsp. michiganensis TaxID=33013 RepID=A0A251XJN3_CLAMM|nr:hypothetical protein BC477_03330 [Clavibacter michiganensis subsp. michiganensis]OUE03745.1 hypothetical protein CMMCAS07_02265 [Clavibacter michiganensis subsp. michiganensis]